MATGPEWYTAVHGAGGPVERFPALHQAAQAWYHSPTWSTLEHHAPESWHDSMSPGVGFVYPDTSGRMFTDEDNGEPKVGDGNLQFMPWPGYEVYRAWTPGPMFKPMDSDRDAQVSIPGSEAVLQLLHRVHPMTYFDPEFHSGRSNLRRNRQMRALQPEIQPFLDHYFATGETTALGAMIDHLREQGHEQLADELQPHFARAVKMARTGVLRMASEEDHFRMRQAIKDDPREDTNRLAYADMIEESGGPAIAEALRKAVEQEKTDPYSRPQAWGAIEYGHLLHPAGIVGDFQLGRDLGPDREPGIPVAHMGIIGPAPSGRWGDSVQLGRLSTHDMGLARRILEESSDESRTKKTLLAWLDAHAQVQPEVKMSRRDRLKLKFAQLRAPDNGMVVRGQFFPGGNFVPQEADGQPTQQPQSQPLDSTLMSPPEKTKKQKRREKLLQVRRLITGEEEPAANGVIQGDRGLPMQFAKNSPDPVQYELWEGDLDRPRTMSPHFHELAGKWFGRVGDDAHYGVSNRDIHARFPDASAKHVGPADHSLYSDFKHWQPHETPPENWPFAVQNDWFSSDSDFPENDAVVAQQDPSSDIHRHRAVMSMLRRLHPDRQYNREASGGDVRQLQHEIRPFLDHYFSTGDITSFGALADRLQELGHEDLASDLHHYFGQAVKMSRGLPLRFAAVPPEEVHSDFATGSPLAGVARILHQIAATGSGGVNETNHSALAEMMLRHGLYHPQDGMPMNLLLADALDEAGHPHAETVGWRHEVPEAHHQEQVLIDELHNIIRAGGRNAVLGDWEGAPVVWYGHYKPTIDQVAEAVEKLAHIASRTARPELAKTLRNMSSTGDWHNSTWASSANFPLEASDVMGWKWRHPDLDSTMPTIAFAHDAPTPDGRRNSLVITTRHPAGQVAQNLARQRIAGLVAEGMPDSLGVMGDLMAIPHHPTTPQQMSRGLPLQFEDEEQALINHIHQIMQTPDNQYTWYPDDTGEAFPIPGMWGGGDKTPHAALADYVSEHGRPELGAAIAMWPTGDHHAFGPSSYEKAVRLEGDPEDPDGWRAETVPSDHYHLMRISHTSPHGDTLRYSIRVPDEVDHNEWANRINAEIAAHQERQAQLSRGLPIRFGVIPSTTHTLDDLGGEDFLEMLRHAPPGATGDWLEERGFPLEGEIVRHSGEPEPDNLDRLGNMLTNHRYGSHTLLMTPYKNHVRVSMANIPDSDRFVNRDSYLHPRRVLELLQDPQVHPEVRRKFEEMLARHYPQLTPYQHPSWTNVGEMEEGPSETFGRGQPIRFASGPGDALSLSESPDGGADEWQERGYPVEAAIMRQHADRVAGRIPHVPGAKGAHLRPGPTHREPTHEVHMQPYRNLVHLSVWHQKAPVGIAGFEPAHLAQLLQDPAVHPAMRESFMQTLLERYPHLRPQEPEQMSHTYPLRMARGSPEEAKWLEGIEANQNDHTRKLAFSDWLEEHGDPESTALAHHIRQNTHLPVERCQCGDPGCPMHDDQGGCNRVATDRLYRTDMDDETGTPMCEGCADDAFESGLFSDEPQSNEEDELELDHPAEFRHVNSAGVAHGPWINVADAPHDMRQAIDEQIAHEGLDNGHVEHSGNLYRWRTHMTRWGQPIRFAKEIDPVELHQWIESIRDEPGANSRKLVFADWLDEHGDDKLSAWADAVRRSPEAPVISKRGRRLARHFAFMLGKVASGDQPGRDGDIRRDFAHRIRQFLPPAPEQMDRGQPIRFGPVADHEVHPDLQPTGIAPRLGHLLSQIAAEGRGDAADSPESALAEGILRHGDFSLLPILADRLDGIDGNPVHPLANAVDWRHAPRGVAIDRALLHAISSRRRQGYSAGLIREMQPIDPGWILADWREKARGKLSRKKALAEVRSSVPDANLHDLHHSIMRLLDRREIGNKVRDPKKPDPFGRIYAQDIHNAILQQLGSPPHPPSVNVTMYPDTRAVKMSRKQRLKLALEERREESDENWSVSVAEELGVV